jgi:hypothetical protein
MRRLLVAASIAGLALLVLALPAAAARTWCRTDPLFSVDGKLYRVEVASYPEISASATGPIRVVLSVPSGSDARVLEADNGFGDGYAVSIEYVAGLKARKIGVAVFVPARDGGLPVRVDVTALDANRDSSPATAIGNVNAWVVARAK